MLNLMIVIGVVLVGAYTVLFAIQNLKDKNYLGFIAVTALAVTVVALPLYILYF